MGNVDSLLNLGAIYEKIDKVKALQYYQKAANKENSWGYFNLGIL